VKVYVFGNPGVPGDRRALEVARRLRGVVPGVSFVPVGPNEDVPFVADKRVVILDTVVGISEVSLIPNDDIGRFIPPPAGRFTTSIWLSNSST